MAARGLFSLISLLLVAGAVLFQLFILLAGAVNGNPVNRWYFLQVDTSNIPNAPPVSRWTFWDICDESNGRDSCSGHGYGKVAPAFPLDPPSHRNFNTTTNIPEEFIGTSYYFLMTRFMFAFALIAVFFAACALFSGVLALCTRLGSYLSGFLTLIAAVFQVLMAALMTAAYVKGRDHFNGNGQSAQIGKYSFGFEWAAFLCLLLSTVLFCTVGAHKREKTTYTSSRKGFFGKRSKSTRSRGSFIQGDKDYP